MGYKLRHKLFIIKTTARWQNNVSKTEHRIICLHMYYANKNFNMWHSQLISTCFANEYSNVFDSQLAIDKKKMCINATWTWIKNNNTDMMHPCINATWTSGNQVCLQTLHLLVAHSSIQLECTDW